MLNDLTYIFIILELVKICLSIKKVFICKPIGLHFDKYISDLRHGKLAQDEAKVVSPKEQTCPPNIHQTKISSSNLSDNKIEKSEESSIQPTASSCRNTLNIDSFRLEKMPEYVKHELSTG